MITKNSADTLTLSLNSIKKISNEIIIVDDFSHDKTKDIAKSFNAKVFFHHEEDIGKQKAYALNHAQNKWILSLDADEVIPNSLAQEIQKILSEDKLQMDGYIIPYQNHFLGKPLNFGGEDYKMLRLFKKERSYISPNLVHERFELKSKKIGILKNKIFHYSYRSLPQVYKKFTDYALRQAGERVKNNEKLSIAKLTLYPLHSFWARYIKDHGYKDGIFRIPLDFGFAYMEFLSYFLMIFLPKKK